MLLLNFGVGLSGNLVGVNSIKWPHREIPSNFSYLPVCHKSLYDPSTIFQAELFTMVFLELPFNWLLSLISFAKKTKDKNKTTQYPHTPPNLGVGQESKADLFRYVKFCFVRKGKKEWEVISRFSGIVVYTANPRSKWDFRVVWVCSVMARQHRLQTLTQGRGGWVLGFSELKKVDLFTLKLRSYLLKYTTKKVKGLNQMGENIFKMKLPKG